MLDSNKHWLVLPVKFPTVQQPSNVCSCGQGAEGEQYFQSYCTFWLVFGLIFFKLVFDIMLPHNMANISILPSLNRFFDQLYLIIIFLCYKTLL